MNVTLNRRAKRMPQGRGLRDWRCRWYDGACTGPENARTPGIPLGAASVKRGVKHPACSLVSSAESRQSRAALMTERNKQMALFMDVHNVEGGGRRPTSPALMRPTWPPRERTDVNYMRYWVDQKAEKIFCLVHAPDAEAANTVHRQAHGLVADEIYPSAGATSGGGRDLTGGPAARPCDHTRDDEYYHRGLPRRPRITRGAGDVYRFPEPQELGAAGVPDPQRAPEAGAAARFPVVPRRRRPGPGAAVGLAEIRRALGTRERSTVTRWRFGSLRTR